MDMAVRSYMHSNLHVIDMEATIADLIKLLATIRHTCLPVLDSNADCFGIVSAIDVLKFLADGGNPRATRVWEICSHGIIHVPLDFDVRAAARLMQEHKIHHLIVCHNGRPEGILSSMDVIHKLNEKPLNQEVAS